MCANGTGAVNHPVTRGPVYVYSMYMNILDKLNGTVFAGALAPCWRAPKARVQCRLRECVKRELRLERQGPQPAPELALSAT